MSSSHHATNKQICNRTLQQLPPDTILLPPVRLPPTETLPAVFIGAPDVILPPADTLPAVFATFALRSEPAWIFPDTLAIPACILVPALASPPDWIIPPAVRLLLVENMTAIFILLV